MGEAIVGLAAIYLATIVVYWFALMIFIGWVASQKGRSGGGWFFLAFFFNVIALIALAALPNLLPAQPVSGLNEGDRE